MSKWNPIKPYQGTCRQCGRATMISPIMRHICTDCYLANGGIIIVEVQA